MVRFAFSSLFILFSFHARSNQASLCASDSPATYKCAFIRGLITCSMVNSRKRARAALSLLSCTSVSNEMTTESYRGRVVYSHFVARYLRDVKTHY